MNEKTTFYSKLQASKALDLRDNQGKYHSLGYTLTSFSTLIRVKRVITFTKTKKEYEEVSFFLLMKR